MLRERFLSLAIVLGPVLFVAAYAAGLIFWDCPFHHLTGLDCPGCGMTRAAYWLGRGEVGVAVSYHPFVLPLALGWLFLAVSACLPKKSRERLADFVEALETRTWFAPITVAAFFVYGVVRLAYEAYAMWLR